MESYMVEQLMDLLKIATAINERQDKIFIQIEYWANDSQRIAIAIRSKKNNTRLKYMETYLNNNPLVSWSDIFDVFDDFLGGEI